MTGRLASDRATVADAKGGLTRGGDPAQLGATPITVSELAQIVQGKSRLQPFEPLETGVWIRVNVDAVRAIDQQYRP